jgi:hypothetical protein
MTGRTHTGRFLKISGVTLCIVTLVLGIFLRLVPRSEQNDVTFVLGLLTIPMMLGGALLLWRGRQHAAQATASEILSGEGPQVLYLRPFRADASTAGYVFKSLLTAQLLSGLVTEEEQLRDALQGFGNLVAIGRPGESLPTPGAARIYASDEEWKSVVTKHMQSARLVVIRAGTGQGLLWELRETVRTVDPHKLLILFLRMKPKDYEAFREQAGISLGLILPATKEVKRILSGVSGFMAFSADWRPVFLRLRVPIFRRSPYKPLVRSFQYTLKPVFGEAGVAWQAPPVSLLTIFAMSLLGLIVAGFMVAAGFAIWDSRSSRSTASYEAPTVTEPVVGTAPEAGAPMTTTAAKSPVEEAEDRLQERMLATPSLHAEMEGIMNSPELRGLAPEEAAARAEVMANEISRKHARAGLRRLPDEALLTKLELDRKLLSIDDSASCAAFARGNITYTQLSAMLEHLEAADIDQWFEVSFQALQADVEGLPGRSADEVWIGRSLNSILQAMPEKDAVRVQRISAHTDRVSDKELCWCERTIRNQIAGLDRRDQILWALSMAQ